jgi:ABC-type multidrug transport system fused ATPase/permease subunit
MKEFCNNLKFAWYYAKDEKNRIIKYIILSILNIVVSIVVPVLSAKIIVALTSNQFYQIILIAIALFLLENVRNIRDYIGGFYSQIIFRESFIKIQTHLGGEILKLQNESIDKNSSGVFIQRLTNDSSRLAEVFNLLNHYISDFIIYIGYFIAIFIVSKLAFIYIVISTIILYLVERIRVNKYNQDDKIYRKKVEKTSGFVGELVRGVRDIKMLNTEVSFMAELHKRIKDLNQSRYDMQDVNRKYNLLSSFLSDLSDLLLIILLVVLMIRNNMSAAVALIIYNYSDRVTSVIYAVRNILDKVKDFNLSASRIMAIINGDEFKKESFGTKHLTKVKGNFEFKNVCFSYDKKQVLNDLSFKVKANETVAFVGKSGAGKTTIFNLLCKMYDVSKGEILIDGYNINELDKDTIRGNITVISQNPYIFNMTIRENLCLVKENLSEEEMKKACKMACLDEFIESLPDKYDTLIGEGGVNLSGGQKQRLAIARAFVQNTEIILFDEATSALDNETQSGIKKAIDNMKKKYTILIIAHRLSTVIDADRLLYVEDGKIVGEGTHEELLKNNKSYRELYEIESIK